MQLAIFTGISRPSVTVYMKHYQQLISGVLEEEDSIIGGDGIVVEIDESKFGKRKHHWGHRVDGV